MKGMWRVGGLMKMRKKVLLRRFWREGNRRRGRRYLEFLQT